MIEWLQRVEGDRPFLFFQDRAITYGEAAGEVNRRLVPEPTVLDPKPDRDSVFASLAGLAGGGLVVASGHEAPLPPGRGLTVFTSGTTGAPKPVYLTLGNLEAAAKASADHLGHGADDNWLLAMSLRHVGGLSILVRQAYTGGSITLLGGFEPEQVAAAMSDQVTMASVVPTMLRRLLPHGPFSGLRAVLVGGGPIPAGLLEQARAAGLPAVPTYGMTETFGQVATLLPDAPLSYAVDPLPGVDIVVRPDRRIAIRGPQVAASVADEDGWLETNDLGEMSSDGSLRVLGRADNVIVTGGVNVNPEQIETLLAPHVDDVVVFGVLDEEWGEMVVCVYVGETNVEEVAARELQGPVRPKRFVRVDSIPKTELGKPDRSALERLL